MTAPSMPNGSGVLEAVEILESFPDAAAVVDAEWRIRYVNRAARALAGAAHGAAGVSLWEIVPQELRAEARGHLERAMAQRTEAHFDFSYRERRYEARIQPAGKGLAIFLRDTSGLYCYRRLFETTAEGILIVNDEGRYVDVNPSFCRILKTTRERLVGAHFSEFIPEGLARQAEAAFENLRTGAATPAYFPLRAADGTIVELAWTTTNDYLPGLHFCCCQDIGERKRGERERGLMMRRLRQAAANAERAEGELRRSNEDLRRANRDLEMFAYSASHDLQEPLRNISIFAQLLERKLSGTADGDAMEFLRGVTKGTRRMENLVQDLLAYSRASRPAEGPVPVIDAAAVLEGVMQAMKRKIEESGAEIEAGELPALLIHPAHLQQVFHHLLSNAMKFRDLKEPKAPQVRVTAELRAAEWVISVADNGIGIDARYATQIFGLFKRLHSRNQYPGSGVGLAICQRILEQYGGRIWLEESAGGRGSVFSFSLPDHGAN